MTVHVTIELTDEEHARLQAIAAHEGVSLSDLFMGRRSEIIDDDEAYAAAVEEGRRDIEAGRYSTLDDALARIRTSVAAKRQP